MLSVNSALFFHIVIFLAVVLLCHPLVIKPTMALLEERVQKIKGARDKARLLQEESDARLAEIERNLEEARRQGLVEREEIRSKYVREAEEIVNKAREDSQGSISRMKESIAKELEEARSSLSGQVEGLGADIAERVLGRKVA